MNNEKIIKDKIKMDLEQYFNNLRIAKCSFELYKGIKQSVPNYKKEIQSISYFLQTTIISLQTTFIMETFKLVDIREEKNIFKLLNICEEYYNIFPQEHIAEVIDNETGNVEKIITKIDILRDIQYIRNQLKKYDILILNLKGIRDKYYAHSDKEYFNNAEKVFKDYNINSSDFEKFLEELLNWLNELSIDLYNESWFIHNPLIEEVEYMLKAIKLDMNK